MTETDTISESDKQKEIALSQQLHESVQGLLKMNDKTDSARPEKNAPSS
jgi:hypothetical protein